MIKRIKKYIRKLLVSIIIEDINNDGTIRQIINEEKIADIYFTAKFPKIIKKAGCESNGGM